MISWMAPFRKELINFYLNKNRRSILDAIHRRNTSETIIFIGFQYFTKQWANNYIIRWRERDKSPILLTEWNRFQWLKRNFVFFRTKYLLMQRHWNLFFSLSLFSLTFTEKFLSIQIVIHQNETALRKNMFIEERKKSIES